MEAHPPEKWVRVSADTLLDVEDSRDEALQSQDEVAAYIDNKTPKKDSLDLCLLTVLGYSRLWAKTKQVFIMQTVPFQLQL